MSGRITRRSFLRSALVAAGAAGLFLAGLAGRAGRAAARAIRIPVKPFDPTRLEDPHDLAG